MAATLQRRNTLGKNPFRFLQSTLDTLRMDDTIHPDGQMIHPHIPISTTEFYFYLTTVSYYYFYLTTVLYGQIAKNGTLPEKSWDMRYDQVVPRTKQEHRVEGNRD